MSVEHTRWEHRRYDPHARMAVSMDGGIVHVRGEGWKELNVRMVGTLAPAAQRDPAVSLRELRYTAILGEFEPFQRARLSGPGMRWSRVGVERMVILRSAVLDDIFDHLWAAA